MASDPAYPTFVLVFAQPSERVGAMVKSLSRVVMSRVGILTILMIVIPSLYGSFFSTVEGATAAPLVSARVAVLQCAFHVLWLSLLI